MVNNQNGVNELNFKKILLELEVENKTQLNNILFNNDEMKKLHTKTYEAHKFKINQDCNKYFADIHYFSRQANISDDFQINSIPLRGKEKQVDLLKKQWKKCVDEIKEMEIQKNSSIRNLLAINTSFLGVCLEDCRSKATYNEGKACVKECYDYHKNNTIVCGRIIKDVLLKYIDNLNIIYDK